MRILHFSPLFLHLPRQFLQSLALHLLTNVIILGMNPDPHFGRAEGDVQGALLQEGEADQLLLTTCIVPTHLSATSLLTRSTETVIRSTEIIIRSTQRVIHRNITRSQSQWPATLPCMRCFAMSSPLPST
jgi:hypothetical protein